MHDQLLEWCSERREASLSAFQEAHDWLKRVHSSESEWGLALYILQTLGHVEVDWARRRWAVTPSVITALDDSGGNALLVGARPRWLMRRLLTLHIDPDPTVAELSLRIMLTEPFAQLGAPSAFFMTSRDDQALAALCEHLGVRFEHRVSMRLREILPSLDSYLALRAGRPDPPPPGVEPRRLVVPSLRWDEVDDDDEPGTYEYQGYGAPRYQFVTNAERFEVEKGIAIYAELRRTRFQAIHYEPAAQRMHVPGRAALPLLVARCAVLRTGLLPTFSRGAERRFDGGAGINSYENIPPLTYRAICDALGQDPSRGFIR